jgi:hypothetical protein
LPKDVHAVLVLDRAGWDGIERDIRTHFDKVLMAFQYSLTSAKTSRLLRVKVVLARPRSSMGGVSRLRERRRGKIRVTEIVKFPNLYDVIS